jgi:hypothetical protein
MQIESLGRGGITGGLRVVHPSDAYLETLFADVPAAHLVEVRWRSEHHQMRSEFFPVGIRGAAAARLRELARSTDAYVGCAPRTRRAGTRDAIGPVPVLWVDCDGELASARVRAWSPPPTMVVSSGSPGCLHAYWRLAMPLEPRAAELANLRLAKAVGADARCYDAARILRPAGTFNHKSGTPLPVALDCRDASARLEADSVLAAAPILDAQGIERRWDARAERDGRGDPLLRIAPRVYVAALLGRSPARNGKVCCPFHEDERPSLHVYREPNRGWCCYSCGRGGSVYDLAAALWGLQTRGGDFIRLRRRLLDTLGLDRGRSL